MLWKPVQAIEKIKLYTLDQGKSEIIFIAYLQFKTSPELE